MSDFKCCHFVFTDIQNNINLQTILNNQDEILRLLRSLTARQSGAIPVDVRDLVPTPLSTVEELDLLCEKLNGMKILNSNW